MTDTEQRKKHIRATASRIAAKLGLEHLEIRIMDDYELLSVGLGTTIGDDDLTVVRQVSRDPSTCDAMIATMLAELKSWANEQRRTVAA